ncbi:MAG: hypothetical protein LBU04_02210 [Christensenellaceae bacterium]|jgi:hypothetical protein|nr:hypothetical protein [Christensenellaceae bacterium]
MSRKRKKEQESVTIDANPTQRILSASFRIMNNCGPVPVAKPADFIQLTPIVQPMVTTHRDFIEPNQDEESDEE